MRMFYQGPVGLAALFNSCQKAAGADSENWMLFEYAQCIGGNPESFLSRNIILPPGGIRRSVDVRFYLCSRIFRGLARCFIM